MHTFKTVNIRTRVIAGELFFCARDLKTPLNIDVNETVQALDKMYLIAQPIPGIVKGTKRLVNATFISLNGVYYLCKQNNAKQFKQWIKSEVVPSEMV